MAFWKSSCLILLFHFSVQKLAGVEGGRPVLAAEGADALLTCVTRNLGDNTLMWKYGSDKVTLWRNF